MKINKLLIVTPLALSATVAPLTMTTSCSNAWGHKSPLSIGSITKNDANNPYFNFKDSTNLVDADGKSIVEYLPSNYIYDQSASTNYSYATPISKWYKTENNINQKLPTDEWTVGTSDWYSSSPGFTTSATCQNEYEGKKYNVTEACAQNVTLTANTSFVVSIAQFINKYVNYALNYATSQVHDATDFNVAWGGNTPSTSSDNKKALYEWMFANSNSHAGGETEVFLKTTQANFNFQNFPIPSYRTHEGSDYKEADANTRKLLTGKEDGELGANSSYWSEKAENGSGDDKYTVYTYPAVPVLIRATNLTQRWINPKITNSKFVTDYYQNDTDKIVNAIGNNWSKLKDMDIGHDGKPSIAKYDIKTQTENAKAVNISANADQRIVDLKPQGNDFIGFITYSYVEWNKPNPTLNRNNTVTLSSLQTIMPAYFLEIKSDLFKKVRTDDNAAYIVDVNKADSYSTELINLLSRNSDQGRVAKASNLNEDSKKYLKFLYFMFAKNDKFDFDFVTTTNL